MEHLNKNILHYKLTKFIDEGGMASVYVGTHEKLGTRVAVKILNPILTANAQIRVRFENEAKLMASLNHPNITKVIDYEDQPSFLAFVMELLEGDDLSTLIKTKGALSPKELLPIFTQILDAFQYAHEKGIVHRDIKPSNIYILPNNQVKILDFGIAKIFGSGDDLTSTGMQMGTPVYMSPEQVKTDKTIDNRSDIYSLGVTLFFALNGKPPYDSETQSNFDIFNKVVYEPIPDLVKYPEINAVIRKACAKDRNERFHDANEFKKALIDSLSVKKVVVNQKNDEKTLIDIPSEKIKVESPKIETKIQQKPTIQKEIVSEPKVENKKNRKPLIFISLGILAVLVIAFFSYLKYEAKIANQKSLENIARMDSIVRADSIASVKLLDSLKVEPKKQVEIIPAKVEPIVEVKNKSIEVQKKVNWIEGKWEGVGYQIDGHTWKIVLNYISDDNITIEYPDLFCSGYWTIQNKTENKYNLIEKITAGTDKCDQGAEMVVEKISNKEMSIVYYLKSYSDSYIAKATMRKLK